MVRALLDAGAAGIDDRNGAGRFALHIAAAEGHIGALSVMIEHGVVVSAAATKHDGWTALHYAAAASAP